MISEDPPSLAGAVRGTHPDPRHPRAVGAKATDRQRSARVVHQLLRSAIKSGILRVGEPLQEDRLITSLDSTRTSVRSALQMLAVEGLVDRRRQSGTFVARAPSLELPFEDITPIDGDEGYETELIGVRLFPAHEILIDHLRGGAHQFRMLEFILTHRGEPIGLLISFQIEPNEPLPDVGRETRPQIARTFEAVYGRPFGSMSTVIDAVSADEQTARMLGTVPGAILLVREQTLTDIDGRVHEYAWAHYRADRVSFRSGR